MAGNNLGVAVGSIQINTSSLKNADLALRGAGRSMTGFGEMALGAFGEVVGEAAKFEKEMDFVQAVTAANSGEMDALKAAAIDLGKNSVYGPNELAKAFVELAKAGATTQQIIDGVGQASVNLATASDVEIPFAGEALLGILNTFKLGAGDAVKVSDLLAGAANASAIGLEDLVLSMKYAGPVANGLGIDIADVTSAMAMLGKIQIKGSTAGTSLRQIMLNLSPATEAASDRMEALGILTKDGSNQFFDAQGNAKSLSQVFDILGKSMAGLNNEQKTAALRDLFGVRSIPSAIELMSQGSAGFAAMNDEIGRSTATDVAAKRMDNLDGSIKRLKSTIQAVMIDAGGPFQNMLKGFVDGLRDLILWVDRLPGPLKSFLLGGLAAVGVLSVIAGAFLLTIGNIVRAIRVIGELGNAFRVISGIFQGFGSLLAANPVVLIIAAIVALGVAFYLLYTRVKGFREFIDKLIDGFQAIPALLEKFFGNVPGWIDTAWDAVSGFFSRMATAAGDAVSAAGGAIGGFFQMIGGFFADVGRSIGSGFMTGLRAIGDFFTSIGGAASRGVGTAMDALGKLPGIIGRAMGDAAGAVGRFVSELPRRIGYAIGWIVGRFLRLGVDIPVALYRALASATAALMEGMTWLIAATARGIASVIAEFVRFVPRAIGAIGSAINGMVMAIGSFMGWFVEEVPRAFVNVLAAIVEWGVNAVAAIATFVGDASFAFMNWIGEMILAIVNGVGSMLSALVSGIGSLGGAAGDIGSSILHGIWDGITALPGIVWDILQAVINTFTGMISTAWSAASDFASGLWEGFKDGLGISSPSFIEEALFRIEDQAALTGKNLANSINSMQRLSSRIPSLDAGGVGIASGVRPAAVAADAGMMAGGFAINGPLLAVERLEGSQEEAISISRRLATLTWEQLNAQGKKTNLIAAGVG